MLENYIDVDKPLKIAFSNDFYISYDGKIFDLNMREQPTYFDETGRKKYKGNLFCGYREYDVAVLVAWTYKGLKYPSYHIGKLDVFFLDGDVKNTHPSNLIWKFPAERLRYRKDPNYAYIPCFSQYVISKEGCLIVTLTGQEVQPYFERGYAKFRLVSDLGVTHAIGRHRLVCLAWLDYPSNIIDLVVNHIDGIPGNDWLDNLELITRAENNKHASETGLLTKGRPVVVRNCFTGEVTTYRGTTQCAEALNLHRTTVQYRLHAPNQPVYYSGLQFKYAYDDTPWREVKPEELEGLELNKGIATKVYFRNIKNGAVTETASLKEACFLTGVPVMTIHGQLNKTKQRRPIDGFDFSYSDGPWREYDDDELFILSETPRGKVSACYVTDVETGVVKLYPSTAKVIGELKVSAASLSNTLLGRRLLKGRYQVKYHPLSESL